MVSGLPSLEGVERINSPPNLAEIALGCRGCQVGKAKLLVGFLPELLGLGWIWIYTVYQSCDEGFWELELDGFLSLRAGTEFMGGSNLIVSYQDGN